MSRKTVRVFMVIWGVCMSMMHIHCDDNDATVEISDITASISDDMATVVVVTWETDAAVTGRVEFGENGAFDLATPMEEKPSTSHHAMLLGMPSRTEVDFRIVVSDDAEETISETQTVTTGELPSYLPQITVEGVGPSGYMVVPIIAKSNETAAVTIIDSKGRIVWYRQDDRNLDVVRARLASDKKSILYNAASISGSRSDNSELVRVSLDGATVSAIPVPLLAHDFVELEDGWLGAIVAEFREVEGEEIKGNQIVEIGTDGTVTPVWSTWDCFDPNTDVGDTLNNGWTFANALDYDPKEDVYYIGFLNLSSIAKIDRRTGACLWVLGSTAETLNFEDGAPQFMHQHQFQVLDDGILVFDNEGALGDESRVIEYEIDFESNTLHEVWRYSANVSTMVLGEPIRFDNGDTLITWSGSGQVNLVSETGETSYQLNLPLGNVFGFSTFETGLY